MKKLLFIFALAFCFSTPFTSANKTPNRVNVKVYEDDPLTVSVPFYEWRTDFETINKENELVLFKKKFSKEFINIKGEANFYYVKSASIYAKDQEIVQFFYLFDDKKLVSIYVAVMDQTIYERIKRFISPAIYSTFNVNITNGIIHIPIVGRRTLISIPPRYNIKENCALIRLTDMYSSPFIDTVPAQMTHLF